MTDAFNQLNQLKQTASTAVSSQLTKQEGWVKSNRKPLLIGAAAMALLWSVAHHFGIG